MSVRSVSLDEVRELDRADIAEDGLCLYAWGASDAGETVLWTFDPRQPPGQQERLVVIEDEKTL